MQLNRQRQFQSRTRGSGKCKIGQAASVGNERKNGSDGQERRRERLQFWRGLSKLQVILDVCFSCS